MTRPCLRRSLRSPRKSHKSSSGVRCCIRFSLTSGLARLFDDRTVDNSDRPTDTIFESTHTAFLKQLDAQQTQPLLPVSQPFQKRDIRNASPVDQFGANICLTQRISSPHM